MGRSQEQKLKLSYESDGKMGEERKQKYSIPQQNEEIAEEFFFNTTQNSE